MKRISFFTLKKELKKWLFCSLHAIFLIVFTLILLIHSFDYPFFGELSSAKNVMTLKNLVFGLEEKPDSSAFLFVNVSWDRMTINKYDPQAPEVVIGTEQITDRKKLSELLGILVQNPNYKFLMLDIFFIDKTPQDSLILSQIKRLPNVLCSYHRDRNNQPTLPLLKIPFQKLGLSDIEKIDNKVGKFKLIYNDTLKTTPLLIYEKLQSKKIQKGWGVDWMENNLLINPFFLNYRITNFDYAETTRFPKVYLGEWLSAVQDSTGKINQADVQSFVYELTKDKIIFVGDFEDRDIHETFFGVIPGPLVLLNAYLSLLYRDNIVFPKFLIFLFLAYFFISYFIFYTPLIQKPRWLALVVRNWLASFIFYFLFVAVLAFVSYSLWRIPLNFILLGIYIFLTAFFVYQHKLRQANHKLEQEVREKNEQIQRQIWDLEKANTALAEKIELVNQQKQEIETERNKSEKLLLNILPQEVADELKEKGVVTPKPYEKVSILFTDFKGFSTITQNMEAEEIVYELSQIFVRMDKIIEKHGLEKIKTIGDAYMCAGGLPIANQYNPLDAVMAGLEIQSFIQQHIRKQISLDRPFFECRLGINTGKVVAGVVGESKFAYDIWGSAVNIAARLESGGEVGKVNISNSTYQEVKDFFVCLSRGKIEAKNIGLIETYFVGYIKPELSVNGEGLVPNEKFWELRKEKFGF